MEKHRPLKFQCTQCGSTDFDPEGETRLRCRYCRSLYEVHGKQGGGRKGGVRVHIKNGANIVVGKNARIVVRGDILVEKGAKVKMDGTLTLIERGSDERVDAARMRLMGPGRDGENVPE
jgi:hypothetical protein